VLVVVVVVLMFSVMMDLMFVMNLIAQ